VAKKLYIRHATPADEQAVFRFYAENPHEFVCERDHDVWRERLSAGAVTLVENEDGKIVAAAISYPVCVRDENGQSVHMWSELGSMRIILEGIGLFKAVLSMQVMQGYLLEPPEDRFAIEVIIGNDHSMHVFEREGATPYVIPQALEEKVSYSISPDDPNLPVRWFQLGVEHMPQFARNIEALQANSVLRNKQTGEEYELDFSRCALVTQFGAALKVLAGSDYGDPQKPNMKHGAKAFRDKFKPE
jgi:hypothetical protein